MGASGTMTLTNVDLRAVAATGTNTPFSGTSVANCTSLNGFTTTTPVTRYWVGGTGQYDDTTHWSTSTGGSSGASVPLAQDSAIFDNNSFSADGQVVTLDYTTNGFVLAPISSIDSSAVTNHTYKFAISSVNTMAFYGATIAFSNKCTIDASSGSVYPNYDGTTTISANGASLANTLEVNAISTTGTKPPVKLGSDYVTTGDMNSGFGAFDHNGFNFTCLDYVLQGSSITTTLGTGTLTMTGTGTVFQSFNVNGVTGSGANIVCSDTSSALKTLIFDNTNTITLGNVTAWQKLTLQPGAAGTLTMGTLTVNNPVTVTFTSGCTYNITAWAISGTASQTATVTSSTGGSAWTLVQTAGDICADWLSLKDSHASTTNGTIYAGLNSSFVSGNTGWILASCKQLGGFMPFML
jgi:hypothetical protein